MNAMVIRPKASKSRHALLNIILAAMWLCPQVQAESAQIDFHETFRRAAQAEVFKDYDLAFRLYSSIQNAEDRTVLYYLARLYRDGLGTEQNLEKAFQLFYQAAQKGHTFSKYEVGLAYLRGSGVSPDEEMARAWLRNGAARHGDSAWQLYRIAETDQEARQWLLRAAQMKVPEAIALMAESFEKGKHGMPQNLKESRRWKAMLEKSNSDGNK